MTSLCFLVFHSYTLTYSWHPQNVGVFYFAERTDENGAIEINRWLLWVVDGYRCNANDHWHYHPGIS